MERPVERKVPGWHEFLVRFNEVVRADSPLLPTWFDLHARLRPALIDYFANVLWPGMAIEETFQRLARALEVGHGLLDETPRIVKSDFKRIRAKIKDALDGEEEQEFILSRLSKADLPSLKDRLRALRYRVGPRMAAKLTDEFIRKAGTARDDMTHRNDYSSVFDPRELAVAMHLLRLFLTAVLLNLLDYSAEENDQRTLRSADAMFS